MDGMTEQPPMRRWARVFRRGICEPGPWVAVRDIRTLPGWLEIVADDAPPHTLMLTPADTIDWVQITTSREEPARETLP